jgi:hypothetical protein
MIPFNQMTASQSTTRSGYLASYALTASAAVNLAGETCSHTEIESPSWWKVVFVNVWNVEYLVLTNSNGRADRLQNIDVYVGNVQCANNVNIASGATQDVPCVATGSEIKLQHQGTKALTLCGFQAYGTPAPTTVAAMIPFNQMTASQSTTWSGYLASYAVTASADFNLVGGTCTHTEIESLSWWNVVLVNVWNVEYLILTNRNAFADRLQNIDVYVGTVQCASSVNIASGATQKMPCVATGSEIKLQHQGASALTLCGFQAYGVPASVFSISAIKGAACSSGMIQAPSESECQAAAPLLSKKWKGLISLADHVSGCMVGNNGDAVWFNTIGNIPCTGECGFAVCKMVSSVAPIITPSSTFPTLEPTAEPTSAPTHEVVNIRAEGSKTSTVNVEVGGARIELQASKNVKLTVEVTSDISEDLHHKFEGSQFTTEMVSLEPEGQSDADIHTKVRMSWPRGTRLAWSGDGMYTLQCASVGEGSACRNEGWDGNELVCACYGNKLKLAGAWSKPAKVSSETAVITGGLRIRLPEDLTAYGELLPVALFVVFGALFGLALHLQAKEKHHVCAAVLCTSAPTTHFCSPLFTTPPILRNLRRERSLYRDGCHGSQCYFFHVPNFSLMAALVLCRDHPLSFLWNSVFRHTRVQRCLQLQSGIFWLSAVACFRHFMERDINLVQWKLEMETAGLEPSTLHNLVYAWHLDGSQYHSATKTAILTTLVSAVFQFILRTLHKRDVVSLMPCNDITIARQLKKWRAKRSIGTCIALITSSFSLLYLIVMRHVLTKVGLHQLAVTIAMSLIIKLLLVPALNAVLLGALLFRMRSHHAFDSLLCMLPRRMLFLHHKFPEDLSQQASAYVHHMTVGPAMEELELHAKEIQPEPQPEPQGPTLLSPTSKTPFVSIDLTPHKRDSGERGNGKVPSVVTELDALGDIKSFNPSAGERGNGKVLSVTQLHALGDRAYQRGDAPLAVDFWKRALRENTKE